MACGREPGGAQAALRGVCPASTETRLDGTHGGKNAGRACWAVAGTFCCGEAQGTFAEKFGACTRCRFYASVISDEYPRYVTTSRLLRRLREGV